EPIVRLVSQGYNPLLLALPEDPQNLLAKIDLLEGKLHRLGNPQPAGVDKLEKRAVAHAARTPWIDLFKDLLHRFHREDTRQTLGQLRNLQAAGGVVVTDTFEHQELEETAQAGDDFRDRALVYAVYSPPLAEIVLEQFELRLDNFSTPLVEV